MRETATPAPFLAHRIGFIVPDDPAGSEVPRLNRGGYDTRFTTLAAPLSTRSMHNALAQSAGADAVRPVPPRVAIRATRGALVRCAACGIYRIVAGFARMLIANRCVRRMTALLSFTPPDRVPSRVRWFALRDAPRSDAAGALGLLAGVATSSASVSAAPPDDPSRAQTVPNENRREPPRYGVGVRGGAAGRTGSRLRRCRWRGRPTEARLPSRDRIHNGPARDGEAARGSNHLMEWALELGAVFSFPRPSGPVTRRGVTARGASVRSFE
jgi:hypothetical protein